ncbi:MAG: ankyrin repeat domain-containing protein [Helicobacter sp.]|nr:ankyrin repeat domain-containing protein [Helicobacter sp.]
MNGHTGIVKELINKGAGIDFRNKEGYIALDYAKKGKHSEIIRLLNQEYFLQASKNGDIATLRKLLDFGVNVNFRDRTNGSTALMNAAMNGHTEIVKELIDKEAGVNIQKVNGLTALMYAAASGHTEVVKDLLNNGADINLHDKDGRTALDYAKEERRKEIIELLSKREILK